MKKFLALGMLAAILFWCRRFRLKTGTGPGVTRIAARKGRAARRMEAIITLGGISRRRDGNMRTGSMGAGIGNRQDGVSGFLGKPLSLQNGVF